MTGKKKVAYTKVITKGKQGDWFLEIANPMTKDLIHVSVGQFDECICKNIRKLGIKESKITDYFTSRNNRIADGRSTTFSGSDIILVRINSGLGTVAGFGTLVHELLHAVHRLFEGWEKKLKFEKKEELMCCLINFYFEQVITATTASINLYPDKKLSWEDTHYMEFNYSLHKKKSKNKTQQ